MDTYMVIFRILHIFSSVIWVGAAAFLVFVVVPTTQRASTNGAPFVHNMYANSPYPLMMVVSSIVTTVAGLALYDRVSNHFNADWMFSGGGLVMTIGSVAGLLAFGHALFALRKYTRQMGELTEDMGNNPTGEQISAFDHLAGKIKTNAYISFGLMIIAVIGMSAARYIA